MEHNVIYQITRIEIIFQVFMATKVVDQDGYALLFYAEDTKPYIPFVGMSFEMGIGEHTEKFVVTDVTDVKRMGKVVVELGEVTGWDYVFSIDDVHKDPQWKVGEYHNSQ